MKYILLQFSQDIKTFTGGLYEYRKKYAGSFCRARLTNERNRKQSRQSRLKKDGKKA